MPAVSAVSDPAAAFDVLDLDAAKIGRVEDAIKRLNDDVVARGAAALGVRERVRERRAGNRRHGALSAKRRTTCRGARIGPAIAFYDTFANDGSLNDKLRGDASAARDAVEDLVLAHRESDDFEPFGGADYSDAAGPTVHLPTSRRQVDPWASAGVVETDNDFYHGVDEAAMTRVLA